MSIKQMHEAIYALYPNVITIRDDIAYDANGEVVVYNVESVNAQIANTAYISNRLAAYPTINNQLDMLWHAMDNNEIPRANTFYTAIQTVKNAHPKS